MGSTVVDRERARGRLVTSDVMEQVWGEIAALAVSPSPFWPVTRLRVSNVDPADLELLRDAALELEHVAGRDLFVAVAPEVVESCLLAVPSYDDPVKFIGAMRGWQREHGTPLTDRWAESALRSFDRLVGAWFEATEMQPLFWPAETPIPSPPNGLQTVLTWVQSKQPTETRVKLGPLVAQLARAEVDELARRCVTLIEAGEATVDLAERLLPHLACWSAAGVTSVQDELVDRRVLYPGVLFRNASSDISEKLVALAEEPDDRNHALVALAWVNDDVAHRQFAAWRREPPVWESALYVPAHAYASEAGWAVDASGGIRALCADDAKRLVPARGAGAVGTFAAADHPPCPWCGDALTTVFDLDLSSGDLAFLGLPTGRLRVITCERCTAYGEVHTDVDLAGAATWSDANTRPSFIGDGEWIRVATRFELGGRRGTPVETIAVDYLGGRSQLGGYPSWDQDAAYPTCLRCGELMPFIGQIDYADVDQLGEGMLYAFFDPECLTAATTYQQT
jgi:hypothetical protein